MIQFKLFDENNTDVNGYSIEYSIDIDFKDVEEFDNKFGADPFTPSEFDIFMDSMETGDEDYCGIHDYCGDEDYVGFSSYEIENFPAAIEKWKEFFRSINKLIE
jgi:hypothetical protein